MNALWIVLAGLAALLLVLALIRIRVCVSYSEAGFSAVLRIWFYRMKLPPEKKPARKPKKGKKQPEDEQKKPARGGSLSDFNAMLRVALSMLGRALRSIRIDRLDAEVHIAGGDPFSTAMLYGGAAAGCGIVLPLLERAFVIKSKNIRVFADFDAREITLRLEARASVAVWQLVRLGAIFLWKMVKQKQQKGMKNHGGSCTE